MYIVPLCIIEMPVETVEKFTTGNTQEVRRGQWIEYSIIRGLKPWRPAQSVREGFSKLLVL